MSQKLLTPNNSSFSSMLKGKSWKWTTSLAGFFLWLYKTALLWPSACQPLLPWAARRASATTLTNSSSLSSSCSSVVSASTIGCLRSVWASRIWFTNSVSSSLSCVKWSADGTHCFLNWWKSLHRFLSCFLLLFPFLRQLSSKLDTDGIVSKSSPTTFLSAIFPLRNQTDTVPLV